METGTHTGEGREKVGVMLSQAKKLSEAGGGLEQTLPWWLQRERGLAHTLASDSQPPGLRDSDSAV